MSTKEIIKMLCDKKGISVTGLEKELGYGNGSLSKGDNLKSERLFEIAKYFNVTMEFLMGAEGYTYDKETEEWREDENYIINKEAREYAQFLFKHPEHRALFDASMKVKQDDISIVSALLDTFSKVGRNDEG